MIISARSHRLHTGSNHREACGFTDVGTREAAQHRGENLPPVAHFQARLQLAEIDGDDGAGRGAADLGGRCRTIAASIQKQPDRSRDPLAQFLLRSDDLATEDHGSHGAVGDRVHELLGDEAGIP